VFAIFGETTQQKPLVGMPQRRNRYRSPVFPLCVDTGRADIISRLKVRDRGAGFIHLPKVELEFLKQLTSTRALWKWSKGRMTREWTKAYHPRAHVFDLYVYTLAALRMMGAPFIRDLARRAAERSKPAPGGESLEGAPAAPVSDAPAPPRPPSPLQRRSSWVNAALPPGRRR
jgi:phage terminase large subunit GpA-like protein